MCLRENSNRQESVPWQNPIGTGGSHADTHEV